MTDKKSGKKHDCATTFPTPPSPTPIRAWRAAPTIPMSSTDDDQHLSPGPNAPVPDGQDTKSS